MNLDFSQEMEREAIGCVANALQTNPNNYLNAANHIKQAFKEKFLGDWACLISTVGQSPYQCAFDQSNGRESLSVIQFLYRQEGTKKTVQITLFSEAEEERGIVDAIVDFINHPVFCLFFAAFFLFVIGFHAYNCGICQKQMAGTGPSNASANVVTLFSFRQKC